MDVLLNIQKEEQAEGQSLYSGGEDKTRAGWGNSFKIAVGQVIDLTAAQMNKIYQAMGLNLSGKTSADEVVETPANIPQKDDKPPQVIVLPQGKNFTRDKFPLTEIETTHRPDRADQTILVGEFAYEYNSDGYVFRVRDSNGNTLRYVFNYNGSVAFYDDYEYNAEGDITRKIRYNGDGWVSTITCAGYEYDTEGIITRTISYNNDGSVNFYIDSEYNAEGNFKRRIKRGPDGNVLYFDDYKYNAVGDRTIKRYGSDGKEKTS